MIQVVGIDHLALSVSDFTRSKKFYDAVLSYLGFKVLDEYEDAIGWTNGKTRIWISQADARGRRRKHREEDVGFHHYAFELQSRADIDAFQEFLKKRGAPIDDPAGEYYDDYYAVYFLDPDGMRFEAMHYGPAAVKKSKPKAKAKSRPKSKRKP